MATDKLLEFNGVEVVNLARTAQLAEAMGIDSVWVTPESVQWIEDARGALDYDEVTAAPWYDAAYPASAEFAGVIPLGFPGLDDSTTEASVNEYITDGGRSGKQRNSTLSIVGSVALVATTDRGAEYGKRWLDRVLRVPDARTNCVGADLRYYRYPAADAPVAHRRQVRLTRGTVVTRKRSTDCSVTWLATFTLNCDDPFEYGESMSVLTNLGGWSTVNQFINPGFEVNTIGWTAGASFNTNVGATLTRDTSEHDTGVASGKVVTTAVSALQGIYTLLDIPPLTTVVVTARVKATSGRPVRFRTRDVTNSISGSNPADVAVGAGWQTMTSTITTGVQRATVYVSVSDDNTAGVSTFYVDSLSHNTGNNPVGASTFGELAMIQSSCPRYDYTPVYDPLYPALVPSPTAPNFYPAGWDIADDMTFDRFWARIDVPEPHTLSVVPVLTLTTDVDARMVRVSIWPNDSANDDQCDPLFSAVVTYLPAGGQFVIDGEQQASYVWDGFSPVVRRADSLVYSPDAKPVEWAAFNDPIRFMVTLDVFTDGAEVEGDGDVRLAVAFVPKSD